MEKWLSKQGLEFKRVLDSDSFHIHDAFGKSPVPTVDEIANECSFLARDLILNRANKPLSREKCMFSLPHSDGIPFYGLYWFGCCLCVRACLGWLASGIKIFFFFK